MAWRTFYRFGRFAKKHQVTLITTSATTVVVGLVLYEKLKEGGIVFAAEKRSEIKKPTYSLSSSKSGLKWDDNWDRRDPKSLTKPGHKEREDTDGNFREEVKSKTPIANRHLILIRHGQYVDTGACDDERILTALGREQANFTGQRLRALELEYTHLTSSMMSRAIETSDIIQHYLPHLPIVRDPILNEGPPIKPEPYHSSWRPESHQFFQDGARIEAAFRKYFHRADPDQTCDTVEVIVCHANVIRYFICRALQFPPEAWLRLSLAHASLTHILIRPSGRVILKSMGDSGHLPPCKVSFV